MRMRRPVYMTVSCAIRVIEVGRTRRPGSKRYVDESALHASSDTCRRRAPDEIGVSLALRTVQKVPPCSPDSFPRGEGDRSVITPPAAQLN